MNRLAPTLLCSLLVTACSAEVAIDSDPISTAIPVNSILEPTYAEVAIDLPADTQDLAVLVKEVTATLTVVNPSNVFTLNASACLSLTGTATPDQPNFYTPRNLPPYYADCQNLMSANYGPNTRTDTTIPSSETFLKAVRQPRIWFIVSNTISNANPGPGGLPLEIRLENAVLHVLVEKNFSGLEGALGITGL
ncbi:hypothetical protein [Cystobacter ferrugineus]|uniref:Lipoprotein n=1 Tax=Cystobacter ferrugineus TaxID=83449 RepID=A0A1L9BGM2_9BACT|nr:hypothetical protein [Cystobacter ferrugineus]OJH41422.1 hypothetical protein BON30_11230 [Cystobacter ferrugineus]